MPADIKSLLTILELAPVGEDVFEGANLETDRARIFGGQVVAQALAAAGRTVPPERAVHSLHCYFMRPGRPSMPVRYEVDRIRDGGSFTTRRVLARQGEEAIFAMSSSFQVAETSLDHQLAMPDVPMPEDLPTPEALDARFHDIIPPDLRFAWQRERPIEMRIANVEDYARRDMAEPRLQVWMRANGTVPDDPALHRCVLAYASDISLLDTALLAHRRFSFSEGMQMASLDHALWFHRPFRADEWFLFSTASPFAGGARGLSFGNVYARDGTLVASAAQEGLIRSNVRPRRT